MRRTGDDPVVHPMTEQPAPDSVDFVLLEEASKRLFGYYVHRTFHNYLGPITVALHRQSCSMILTST